MACGEGYGSNVLAGAAAERRRRRRQPRGPRARPAALRAPQPALRARPGRELRRALRRGRLPADDRARRRTPARSSSTSSRCWRPAASPTSRRPNLLTLAPPGAEKSDNPWHVKRVPRRRSSASSARPTSTGSSCSASSTPASCAPTSSRSSSAGTRSTSALGLTKPFYDRFTPAIAASDFALRRGRPRPGAGLPRRLPCLTPSERRRRPGDRPPLAHALRRGLRDLPVRRGVAVRRGDPLLPAAARGGARR